MDVVTLYSHLLLAPLSCPPKPAFGRRRMRGEGWGEGLLSSSTCIRFDERSAWPLTRIAKGDPTSPRKRGEVRGQPFASFCTMPSS